MFSRKWYFTALSHQWLLLWIMWHSFLDHMGWLFHFNSCSDTTAGPHADNLSVKFMQYDCHFNCLVDPYNYSLNQCVCIWMNCTISRFQFLFYFRSDTEISSHSCICYHNNDTFSIRQLLMWLNCGDAYVVSGENILFHTNTWIEL